MDTWGPGGMSCIDRFPHFRNKKKTYLQSTEVSFFFRGVLQEGLPLYHHFHVFVYTGEQNIPPLSLPIPSKVVYPCVVYLCPILKMLHLMYTACICLTQIH